MTSEEIVKRLRDHGTTFMCAAADLIEAVEATFKDEQAAHQDTLRLLNDTRALLRETRAERDRMIGKMAELQRFKWNDARAQAAEEKCERQAKALEEAEKALEDASDTLLYGLNCPEGNWVVENLNSAVSTIRALKGDDA
jgi:chromosome segregation ATPase